MGIYAPNVEAPKSCCSCGFSKTANYREEITETGLNARGGRMCSITGDVMPIYCSWRTKMNGCPLVEIPPHGRLIDADALMKMCGMANDCYDCPNGEHGWCKRSQDAANICEAIEDAPTIIPAEEGETWET